MRYYCIFDRVIPVSGYSMSPCLGHSMSPCLGHSMSPCLGHSMSSSRPTQGHVLVCSRRKSQGWADVR